MKRWIKLIGIILLIPVALFLLLAVLLYIPPVQNFVKDKAVAYASRATGMDIRVDRVRLSFPLNLVVEEVEVVDARADTLLHAGAISASVQLRPLFRKEVVVDGVDIQDVSFDSDSLVSGMHLRGALGSLKLKADRALLAEEQVTVNNISLADADIHLVLADTTPRVQDTVQSPIRWKLDLEDVTLDNVALAMDLPLDTLSLAARIGRAKLHDGNVDLYRQLYEASTVSFSGSSLSYSKGDRAALPGFDPSHIAVTDLDLRVDSVSYRGLAVSALIRELSLRERSGLEVESLRGEVRMDSTRIDVPGLELRTSNSRLSLTAEGSLGAFSRLPEGEIKARLAASLGKNDVMLFASMLPPDFRDAYPDRPLTADIDINGNEDKVYIRTFEAQLSDAFRLTADGSAEHIADSLRRSGELKLSLHTYDLEFVKAMLDSTARGAFTLPSDMQLEGTATLAARLYRTQLRLTEGDGTVDLTAFYRQPEQGYGADIKIHNLQLQSFLPHDSLQHITATLTAEGQGTDFFSPATFAKVEGEVTRLEYGTLQVGGISLDGSLRQNRAALNLTSTFAPAVFRLGLTGTLTHREVAADLTLRADTLDLYELHLMQAPFDAAFVLHVEGETDMKKNFRVAADLTDARISTRRQTVHPKDIALTAQSAEGETRADLQSGDLRLDIEGRSDVEALGKQFSLFSNALAAQMKREALDLDELRSLLPDLHLRATAGSDNPVHNFLGLSGINFRSLDMQAETTPSAGVNADLVVNTLRVDTLLLDTVRLGLHQGERGIALDGGIINNEKNRQHVFTATVDGLVQDTGAQAMLRFVNGKGNTGLMLGARVRRADRAWRLSLYPDDPILAFRRFRLNDNNYVQLGDDKKISADLRMEGEDGAVLSFQSQPTAKEGQNLLDLGIRHFNLSLISELLPYMPDIGGLLRAEVQYAGADSTFHVKADIGVDTLSYERGALGDIGIQASYMPSSRGAHLIDAHVLHNQREVLSARGAYIQANGTDSLRSKIQLTALPLWMANPFIPQDMASVAGALDGEMTVTGHISRPELNGFVRMDTASVFVVPAGTRFRFDDKRVTVSDNRFVFDHFNILSSGNNPFVIDGVVDASDFAAMRADLTLSANNMELLNVKRNKESLVYGKVYVDLSSTVRGPLDALVMRGNLDLLGTTNVTYVLKDSPLTVQDRLSDIVTFVNFADTAQLMKLEDQPLRLSGLDMLMTIHIDQAVQLNVDLSEDRQSYANVEGGGDLSFQYSPQGDMILTGRYTINSGAVRYALPVIPAKTFSIKEGSYVEWSGPIADPYIDLTAIERVRTSVTLDDQAPQLVNFDVSIAVKNTLENLSLQFNLSAPENMAVENQLSAMSEEERGKQAIAMLATNMYMAGGSNGKVNTNLGGALNSFLQKEIGNLAGSALKGIDVTLGVDTYDADGQSGGGQRTDYSFQFSKRFYNDRIQVIIGGRISTGVPETETQSFIDNVAVEYRLDASGSRYVKLFHNTDYESILEGEITETGAGLVLRRKMQHLRELFMFRKKKKVIQSTRNEKDTKGRAKEDETTK